MKANRKIKQGNKVINNNMKAIKMNNQATLMNNIFLNKKRERIVQFEQNNGSNDTNTETNETTLKKNNNKERTIKLKAPGSFKRKYDSNKNNQRLNRFNQNEKFIKLNDETSVNKMRNNIVEKKKKEKNNSEKEYTAESKSKNSQRKIYGKIRNPTAIKRKKSGRKNSYNAFIGRLMKRKNDEFKKKFDSLKKEIEEKFSQEKTELETKLGKIINSQNEEINAQNKKIITQNKKIALLSEIQNQSELYSKEINKYVMCLGTQFNHLFNSCKVLFLRKICDFILEGLINKYNPSIALTAYNFTNNAGNKFPLMVFHEDVEGFSKLYLNTIIDYLMETKQNCSSIVHMNRLDDISIPIMKEVFYILLNKSKNEENSKTFNLDIQDMTDIILGNPEQEKGDKLNETSMKIEEMDEEEELDDSNNEGSEISDKDNSSNDDEKIQKLMSDKNSDININDLKNTLKEKIKNKEKGIKDIAIKVNQIISPSYFYKLWKNSFVKEKYKNSKRYKIFIQISYIKSQKEMILTLKKLLSKYNINFFDEDPSKFSQNIIYTISGY